MIDNNTRAAQGYGYLVCLISVIVVLVSLAGLTNSLFDYADPIHSQRYGDERHISSFNAYKRAYYDRRPTRTGPAPQVKTAPPDTISDTALRQMYQEDRTDHIDTTRFRALKSLVGSFLLLIVSIVLFTIHWKWLRRQSARTA